MRLVSNASPGIWRYSAPYDINMLKSDLTDDELRAAVAGRMRRKTISAEVWNSKVVRGLRERYELQRDPESFEDLVTEVKSLIERLREAAGLQSTAPKSPRRQDLGAGSLSALESARALAYGEVLAGDAFASSEVRYVWTKVLKSRWLSPQQADAFLASPAIRLVPLWSLVSADADLIGLESEFIDRRLRPDGSWTATVSIPALAQTWSVDGSIVPGPGASGITGGEFIEGDKLALVRDARGVVFNVGYWRMSTLDELCKRSAPLKERYDWEEYEAIWFVLTAQAPRFRPLAGSISNDLTGRMQVTISPWISDESLLAFMRRLRFAALGRRTVRTNSLSYEVFTFVERQARLAGGHQPSWATLFARWNETVAEQHRFHRRDQMRIAYAQGKRVLLRYLVASHSRGLGRWDQRRRADE